MKDYILYKDHKIAAVTAITPKEQAQGLMFQSWPPTPMIFPYDRADIRKFWMKNTISPLDIVFCRQGRIVSIESGLPLSLHHVGPNVPVDLVLEFPSGMCHQLGMKRGDHIDISYSMKTLASKFLQTLAKNS